MRRTRPFSPVDGGHGVFGFTNEPFPPVEIKGDPDKQSTQQIFGVELSRAYGVVDANLSDEPRKPGKNETRAK